MKPQSGWASVVLVALMLLTVAWSIEAVGWMPGLGLLTPVVIGAVIVGTVLAGLRWMPATLAHLWSLVIGQLVTIYLASFTLVNIKSFQVLQQLDPLKIAKLSQFDKVGVVRDWLLMWMDLAWRGATIRGDCPSVMTNLGAVSSCDMANLFAVVTMALLLWLLSYISTWFVTRYISWWGAVMPSGFALLFNLFSAQRDQSPIGHLGFFLLCALLLATQTHLTLQSDRWRRERIGFSPDLGFEFLRDGLIVAIAVIGFSWLLPTDVGKWQLQQVASRIATATDGIDQQFNRLFPNLNYPARGGGNEFGADMSLGGSISLGQKVIFDARVQGAPYKPRYWRMTAFDTYDGTGWKRTARGTAESDGTNLGAPYALTVPVTQSIKTLQPDIQQLYAAPQPSSVTLPVRVETGAGAGSGVSDVITLESFQPLAFGTTYTVTSAVSVADVQNLQAAVTNDPPAIASRYLGLPGSVPERVRNLALSLTADQPTRFDKATAIESFLNSNPKYKYSEQMDNPPANRDRVDWFLFDEQKGYCDYYSSAFVVLARAAGIPARVAAGYATEKDSNSDPDPAVYRQHEYDAHTWAEVYFPEFGWIDFEPTAGDAPLDRPLTAADVQILPNKPVQRKDNPQADMLDAEKNPDAHKADAPPNQPKAGAPAAAAGGPFHVPVVPLLISLLVAALVAGTLRFAWARPLTGLTAAESTFARLIRVASWLGFRPRPTDTPHEYGTRLGEAIPDGRGEISTIVDAYVRERFGARPSTPHGERLARAWEALRRPFVRAAARLSRSRLRRK